MNRKTGICAVFASMVALGISGGGCALSAEQEAREVVGRESAPLAQPAAGDLAVDCDASPPDDATVFEMTQVGQDTYRFFEQATVDHSVGELWAKARNFEKVIDMALPTVAGDFQWVDGGSPGKIPSLCQFTVAGSLVHEEVYERNEDEYTLRYRLVSPVLGIQGHHAEIRLTPNACKQTVVVFEGEFIMQPGVSIDGLTPMLRQEIVDMKAYLENGKDP